MSEVATVANGLEQNWTGLAAIEAAAALGKQQNDLTAAHEEMLSVGVILHEAVAAFTAAQTELTAALEAARAANCTVEPDGTVTGPPMTEAEHHDIDAAEQRGILVEQIAARISQAVQAADEADTQFAARLNALAGNGHDGSGLNLATANSDLSRLVPGKSGPKAVNSWWNGLSAAEQQTFIHDQPGVYGNMNGIPAVARNEANRIYLGQLLNQFESMPQPLSAADQQKLDGFQAIQTTLDSWGKDNPPLFLLGIGSQGQGRGILAIGNPDRSTNVCAFVPGMTTTLTSIANGDLASAHRLFDSAELVAPSSTTSTIVWLGYDPPPGDPTDPHTLAVMGSWRGQAGGASYDQFLAGIRSTHGSTPLHLTALGHSYGSFTVGQAAQRPGGTGADDIILIGSPGTGAANASQLNVPAGHVWDGAAANDEVTQLPSKLNVGMDSVVGPVLGPAGTAALDNTVDPNQLWFGTDPASGQFGANRFSVANGAALPLLQAHSQYFDPGSSSLTNMAAIVTGDYAKVTLTQPR
ncbi:alpha/beta hydrolase [Streptacidiphilus fuscans]|uniref:DUF1023 domain-containing protein n=1 Tax=Streptacidiphilus fuscans TaxID=2789292 RepID=A0A931BA05_9ACTN|nr:alpha/beta hydrolase [Streptacidiphilus fuscans]MBF9070478.1 hypothetical protein [Streptacidiphilus fuscans]